LYVPSANLTRNPQRCVNMQTPWYTIISPALKVYLLAHSLFWREYLCTEKPYALLILLSIFVLTKVPWCINSLYNMIFLHSDCKQVYKLWISALLFASSHCTDESFVITLHISAVIQVNQGGYRTYNQYKTKMKFTAV
jgi:hypothetical protein